MQLLQKVRTVAVSAWSAALGLMMARLAVLSALLVVLTLLLPADSIAFYAFMALAYIVSIPYALWLRTLESEPRILPLQFVTDLVVVTGVVYYTGGIRSDLALLYPLVILSAGILTTPLHAVQITILSALAYVTLVVLMMQDVLAPYGPAAPPADWAGVLGTLALRVAIFCGFGAASAYVAQRCQYSDRRMSQYQELTSIFFRNVRAGLMLLDSAGRILMVNERACRLLGEEESALLNLPVQGLVAAGCLPIGRGVGDSTSPCYLRRADRGMIPVSFELSWISVPAAAVPGMRRSGMVEVGVLVFTDITRILEMQKQVQRAESVRRTVKLASDIAHEIRNPLAAVSGAAQLFQKLERNAALGDERSAAVLDAERTRIYQIIKNESVRLDQIIESFINHAEFSPDAVAEKLRAFSEAENGAGSKPPTAS